MVKFLPLISAFLLASVVIISLLSFAILLPNENGVNQSIADDDSIRIFTNSLNSTLMDASGNSNSVEDSISESEITLGSGVGIVLNSLTGVWKTMKIIPITIYNLVVGLLKNNILGASFGVILGVIGSILTLVIVVAVIKFLVQGEG